MATGISESSVSQIYNMMLTELDEMILDNKLRLDASIWLDDGSVRV